MKVSLSYFFLLLVSLSFSKKIIVFNIISPTPSFLFFKRRSLHLKINLTTNLGNMSSPSINRWGLNLIWYRFWYTDKNSFFLNHQDSFLNRLILTYIHYGILFYKNIFINKYWYFSYKFPFKNYLKSQISKYFRFVEYKSTVVSEQQICKLRVKTKNIYISKIWILRYQNWVVVNFYFFQPAKSRIVAKKIKNSNLSAFSSSSFLQKSTFYRYKLTLFYLLNNICLKNSFYFF